MDILGFSLMAICAVFSRNGFSCAKAFDFCRIEYLSAPSGNNKPPATMVAEG
jgi:hypothetical protein